ncbi:DUF4168 domain-containing protein [Oceanibaculum pacificum]|uniref:DUF4168 domain-containing protein n=1 Tax=Oceanibaculum pacificum TaxID=580166 RepID=A0A154VQ45_9PROT|nr:DUF4168 domain-containing protein [Oceanibaculum pacificum]KZD03358.1 hypothetical protein AUP43_13195 [Oceanibaculum pacificum]
MKQSRILTAPLMAPMAAAFLLAAAPLGLAPAMAQSAPPAAATPAPPSAAQISESQIDSYAEAALEINSIRTKWEPQIRQADSPEKAADAHREANKEMVSAVQNKGLSVEEYNSITAAAEADPDLSQKIVAMINEKR